MTEDTPFAVAETIRLRQELDRRAVEIKRLRAALTDMRAGWHYIRLHYGDLDGVGWDRCEQAATAALERKP